MRGGSGRGGGRGGRGRGGFSGAQRGGRGGGRDRGRGRGGGGSDRGRFGDFHSTRSQGDAQSRDYHKRDGWDDNDYYIDKQRDRKAKRKADKAAMKQARIAAQERWSAQRRRAKEQQQQQAKSVKDLAQVRAEKDRRTPRSALRRSATGEQQKRSSPSTRTATHGLKRSRDKTSDDESEDVEEEEDDDDRFDTDGDEVSEQEEEEFEEEEGEEDSSAGDANETDSDDEEQPDARAGRTRRFYVGEPSSASASGLLVAAPPSSLSARRSTTQIPQAIVEANRRIVNRLTMANVVDLSTDVTECLLGHTVPGVPRAVVLESLMNEIDRLCRVDTGAQTQTTTLPFAGLIRALQIEHGTQVGADLLEHACYALQQHLADGEEVAATAMGMILAQWYLLYGVDSIFTTSVISFLLDMGKRERGNDATAQARILCAAACAVAMLRACGEKLVKESPGALEQALHEAKAVAPTISSRFRTTRFDALVGVMREVAAGHTRSAKRSRTESEAPVEKMLDDLCAMVPGANAAVSRKGGAAALTQKRTLRRLIQTANTLTGLSLPQVLQTDKPARWYVAGTMRAPASAYPEQSDAESESASDSASHSGDSENHDEEEDEHEARQRQIQKLREEEKAISGQRFSTEHQREVFRVLAASTDDLECFSMLMQRDPTYTRFHDVCEVLLQCCFQEKTFNPFYVNVLERFCSARPACIKVLQFSLWDRFKSIRIEAVDVTGYFNLACLLTTLIEHGTFTLSVLRGLDLSSTNKTVSLFTRITLLRLLLQLPAARLIETFFGGNGVRALDLRTETSEFRQSLKSFVEEYFINEAVATRWLPLFYSVVAAGTAFDVNRSHADTAGVDPTVPQNPEAALALFQKRMHVAFKSLKQGIM